jgi:hypothetical protein
MRAKPIDYRAWQITQNCDGTHRFSLEFVEQRQATIRELPRFVP